MESWRERGVDDVDTASRWQQRQVVDRSSSFATRGDRQTQAPLGSKNGPTCLPCSR